MDEHSVEAMSQVLIETRLKTTEPRAKNEVEQLLCRLKRDLSEQDYNYVINFVNYQNGIIVAQQQEIGARKALITSLETQVADLTAALHAKEEIENGS